MPVDGQLDEVVAAMIERAVSVCNQREDDHFIFYSHRSIDLSLPFLRSVSSHGTFNGRKRIVAVDGPSDASIMSAKYAFSNGLKELRFLFCHTSSHGDATRSDTRSWSTAVLYFCLEIY